MRTAEPLVIRLSGELDIARKEELREMLRAAYEEPAVIIDLSGVDYLDLSAVNALIAMHAERKKRVFSTERLVGLSPYLRRILKITALDGLWPLLDSVHEAERSFG